MRVGKIIGLKYYLHFICMSGVFISLNAQRVPADMHYSKISQSLLLAVRTGDESSDSLIQTLTIANGNHLKNELSTDAIKKAFWLNIYNVFVQNLLKENPDKYNNRNSFFTDKQITIAGKKLSLDDIEHGILRRSKVKLSLGYLNKLFPPAFERSYRVKRLDYRIHFALNCGAKSCPPIAYYEPDKIEGQLELATRSYLSTEVEYDKVTGILYLPQIMSWFRADFKGKKGIKKLLKKYQIVQEHEAVNIKFKDYDWDLYLNNYRTE